MGCDIHIHVETKKNGQWKKVGNVFDNPYYDEKYGKESWNYKKTDSPYGGRNYDLFAILANVRNGNGFAGYDTGDGFIPMDMPRGLPKDVTQTIKNKSEEWGVDGHSHSYFNLQELNEYDWNRKTKHRGFVTLEEYKQLRTKGEPRSWCSMVDGGAVVKISNKEMEKMSKKGIPKDGKNYYTHVEWESDYKSSVGENWFTKTIPALTKLAKNPKDVRIVFWFDN